MKRFIFFIFLFGTVVITMFFSSRESRVRGPASTSTGERSFAPAPPPAAPVAISRVASAVQPDGNAKSAASPVGSPATVTSTEAAHATETSSTNPPALDIGRELSAIAATNPAAALELAARLDPTQHPEDVMEDLMQQWADADPLAAAAWAKLNTDGEQQSLLLQRVGFVLSQTSPVDAAEFVQTEMPDGPVQDEAIMTVVNQWGSRDLAAAAAWVKTLPEGPLQQRAVEELEGIENYRQALVAGRD